MGEGEELSMSAWPDQDKYTTCVCTTLAFVGEASRSGGSSGYRQVGHI